MRSTTRQTADIPTDLERPRVTRRPGRLAGGTAAVLVAGFLALPGGVAQASTPADGARVVTTDTAPVLTAVTTSRPKNGAVLVKRGSGSGKLTVDNTRGTEDAAVTLSRGDRAVLLMYVRAGSRATASRVPDGTFDVFVERGGGWDRDGLRFSSSTSAGRFDRQARFDTERVRGGIRYSTITVTLHGVPDGNARVLSVPESAVPN